MSNPRHLPPAAGGPAPDPGLAERSCPDCGRQGTLTETLGGTPTTAASGRTVAPGRSGWVHCSACPWSGPLDHLVEARLVAVPGGDAARVGSDVLDCFRNHPRPEGGGGGGSGKGRRKPAKRGDRGERRPDQDPIGGSPDRPEVKTTVVETRSEVVHVRVSKGDKTLAQALANSHEMSVSDLMLWGLRLANGFTPPAWWEMQQEAQRRGLPDPTALLAHGFTEWWRLNVRETLG